MINFVKEFFSKLNDARLKERMFVRTQILKMFEKKKKKNSDVELEELFLAKQIVENYEKIWVQLMTSKEKGCTLGRPNKGETIPA